MGISAVSAPIRDQASRMVAALGMPGPASRMTPERITDVSAALIEAAGAISRRLGWQGRSSSLVTSLAAEVRGPGREPHSQAEPSQEDLHDPLVVSLVELEGAAGVQDRQSVRDEGLELVAMLDEQCEGLRQVLTPVRGDRRQEMGVLSEEGGELDRVDVVVGNPEREDGAAFPDEPEAVVQGVHLVAHRLDADLGCLPGRRVLPGGVENLGRAQGTGSSGADPFGEPTAGLEGIDPDDGGRPALPEQPAEEEPDGSQPDDGKRPAGHRAHPVHGVHDRREGLDQGQLGSPRARPAASPPVTPGR